MPLPYEVDKLDGIDPKIAGEYVKGEDGKFRLGLDLPDGFKVENVSGLTTALSRERENVKKANERLAKLGDIDPEAAVKAYRKVEEWGKSGDPESKLKAQIESIQAQLAEAHGKEKAALQKQLEEQEAELREAVHMSQIDQAIAKSGGKASMLKPLLLQLTRMEKVDGKRAVRVYGPDGMVRVNTQNANAPFTLDMQLEELKKHPDWSAAFPATGNSGGGTTGSGAGGGTGGKLGSPVTISRADARDRQKFKAAEERAAKAGVRLEIVD